MQHSSKYIDFRKIALILLNNWYLFVLFLVLSFGIAILVNKYSVPRYSASSMILVKIENENRLLEGDFLQGLSMFGGERNFQNELLLLQSTPLVQKTVFDLDMSVSYFEKKHFFTYEIYTSSPFIVDYNITHVQPVSLKMEIEILDNSKYRISAKGKNVKLFDFVQKKEVGRVDEISFEKEALFGETVENDYYNFVILLKDNKLNDEALKKKYVFTMNDLNSMVSKYKNNLKVVPAQTQTTAAKLTLEDKNPQKAVDFLENYTEQYLKLDLDKKNYIALNTVDYIDQQLNQIEDSLTITESELQNFRVSHQVMDISTKSNRIYDQLQELENERAELAVRAKYYDYIKEYFDENEEFSDLIAPSAMGIEDPLLTNLIEQLTSLNSQISLLKNNNQQKSPYYTELNSQINNLKKTIQENINYIITTSNISLREINSRISQFERNLNELPQTQRQLLGIERKFNLNDQIYTYLLERRAEAQIAKASNLPDNEIIEPAASLGKSFPNTKINFFLAIFFGLFIPAGYLIGRDLFQSKLMSRDDVEAITEIPIVGTILHGRSNSELAVFEDPKSLLSESFRKVRTNLDFFGKGEGNKIILVTSCFPSEGKTFVAINLAAILSMFDKKTVILGFDLRNPTLQHRLKLENLIGISSYLINKSVLDDIVIKSEHPNLDVILTGDIPPNPSELNASKKTAELFDSLRERYEYIIVDSPPLALVDDTYSLMKHSDINIIVTRLGQTDKFGLKEVLKEMKNKNFTNLSILLNDLKVKSSRYGYGYYYHKYDNKKSKLFGIVKSTKR